jgi:hypothetical protein
MKAPGIMIENDPIWVEVPRDSDLINDGFTKSQLADGGNILECIKGELDKN